MKIGVFVPTYNAGELWKEFLVGIDMQCADITCKIILDSGSKDDIVCGLALKANHPFAYFLAGSVGATLQCGT